MWNLVESGESGKLPLKFVGFVGFARPPSELNSTAVSENLPLRRSQKIFLMANPKKLQLSLILRFAGKIWQILQITSPICRILQIPRGSANSKPNIQKKNLQKSVPKKSYNFPLMACYHLLPVNFVGFGSN